MFAFTAFEAFLSRLFKKHRERLLEHRQGALAREIEKYIGEIEQRRKDQGRTDDDFPIAYKFALVASYLGLEKIAEKADKFDDVTDERNAIAHGYDFDAATLPTAEVWHLLGQLVRSYIKREGQVALRKSASCVK